MNYVAFSLFLCFLTYSNASSLVWDAEKEPTAPPSGYTSPANLLAAFNALQAAKPQLARVIDLTAEFAAPRTFEGRTIKMIKISDNVLQEEDEPNVLIVSNHHARELITPEIALNISRNLVLNYDTNSTIRALVDQYQIYVIWTLNPDGLEYVWTTNNNWRKNRRPNADGTFGVDINRNYPFGWNFTCGGATTPSSEEYRGPSAGSEPETQTLMRLHETLKFAKVLDFHSYARDVRQVYASCASLPTVIDNYFTSIGLSLARAATYTNSRSCCMGGEIAFAYHTHGGISYLVETGTAFQPPALEMQLEVARIWPLALVYLQMPIPVFGHTVDAETGRPVAANLRLPAVQFNYNEQKMSQLPFGRFNIWLPSGSFSVNFTAPGYAAALLTVQSPSSMDHIVKMHKL